MSKADQIIANTSKVSRRKSGFLGRRGRIALLALTTLLVLFVFLTQPNTREALANWTSLISG
ncbi:hypothetical protein [Ruegeria profundi]|uniref:Uncharacterized protein n=1 Tax=Ruegeria profundi TaxID=1685378 RepID=A0A0X3TSI6_9RHOB|nr:hypothetical protein [Ruegeria profundi]KUJ78688.1 hypothetical protein AVO44_13400 [Ruegeria profundi]MCA0927843.1 hypothetical protein [Ruegeria profundi]